MQLTCTLYNKNQSGFKIYGLPVIRNDQIRVVTKISSCQVNTTSRQGIKQLGISFGSIFLLFSYESRGTFIIAGGNPQSPALYDK